MQFPKPPLPFYFGQPGKRLFGCYHEPSLAWQRECAIVICQPLGHEYINSHRALRQLATNLANAGFPVLRFDYFGCGDSDGEALDGQFAQWIGDIFTAIDEVRKCANVQQVCLIGLRLGAALATLAAAQRDDIESLVLWDPAVDGETYLDELTQLHEEMLRFRPKLGRLSKSSGNTEVLCFPFSSALRSEVKTMNLRAIAAKPAKNVLLLRSKPMRDDGQIKALLSKTAAHVEYQQLDAPQVWLPLANGNLLVPRELLQSIVAWTSRMHA